MSGRLIHLNGAPGAGKSTLAKELVAAQPGWLNLDIDVLRRQIGGWEHDHATTGNLVRPLALAMIAAHLVGGRDVVLPQLLVDPNELRRFGAAAADVGGSYHGILLDLPDELLAMRWRGRDTTDPTTAASNRVITGHGGDRVVLDYAQRLREMAFARPDVTVLHLGGGDVADSLARVERLLA